MYSTASAPRRFIAMSSQVMPVRQFSCWDLFDSLLAVEMCQVIEADRGGTRVSRGPVNCGSGKRWWLGYRRRELTIFAICNDKGGLKFGVLIEFLKYEKRSVVLHLSTQQKYSIKISSSDVMTSSRTS